MCEKLEWTCQKRLQRTRAVCVLTGSCGPETHHSSTDEKVTLKTCQEASRLNTSERLFVGRIRFLGKIEI